MRAQPVVDQSRVPERRELGRAAATAWPRPSRGCALTKHFFFPGFIAGTGGLIARVGPGGAPRRVPARCRGAGATVVGPGACRRRRRTSCGSRCSATRTTATAGTARRAWAAESPAPVVCLVPDGRTALQVSALLRAGSSAVGDAAPRAAWTCASSCSSSRTSTTACCGPATCNFVRGEDSFVRAQWAARPLVWQIYPQQDGRPLAQAGRLPRPLLRRRWHRTRPPRCGRCGDGLEPAAADCRRRLGRRSGRPCVPSLSAATPATGRARNCARARPISLSRRWLEVLRRIG
ncbi:MAG: elongation factor P maturation arginine rhamnosyltransferase EarP [Comamonadaceae bacterium]|nr:elongation factor P maturation arginine rhamnosyltransferase EarP [Comamonadaceae bacterium]